MEEKKTGAVRKSIDRLFKGKNPLILIIETALLCVCIYGVYKSCWMNSVGVSLWLDEALLAFSFSKRSLLNLTSGIFEWNQIAPVGWLYINKIMATIFGNTEFVIRLFSAFSYAATLFVIYYISKRHFRLRLPLLCPAFIASMSFALRYSIMFKPYISDGLFTMIAILAYLQYREKNSRSRCWILGIVWAVLLWFSIPVCFVTGGIILSEIAFILFKNVRGIIRKNSTFRDLSSDMVPWIITGSILVLSFVVYYFYWLRPVAVGDPMQDYWQGQNFPLFPKSSDDWAKMKKMKDEIFTHFSFLEPVMMFGLAATLIYGIYKKSRSIVGLYLGIPLMLFASYINMFPVEDRMWYYFYPLALLLFFIGADKLLHIKNEKKGIASLLILAIFGYYAISGNNGFQKYSTAEQVYRSGEELNYEVEYVRSNITEDEKVYVYYQSVAGFQYCNGYDTDSIGGYESNVIYGSGLLMEEIDYGEDLEKITDSHNCYIVVSHWRDARIYGITHDLPQLGWLELIGNDYSTPLFYWTDDFSRTKSNVDLSVVESKEENGTVYMTIRIQNTGSTILNSRFSKAELVSSASDYPYEIPREINQGAYVDINVEFSADQEPVFELVDIITGDKICPSAELKVSQ